MADHDFLNLSFQDQNLFRALLAFNESHPLEELSAPSFPPVDVTGMTENVFFRADYPPGDARRVSQYSESCWEECSSQSCDDACFLDHCQEGCTPSCAGTEGCDRLDVCGASQECTNTTCVEASPAQVGPAGLAASPDQPRPLGVDFSSPSLNMGAGDSKHCLWVNPGQQCNVSVPTMNALGQHVLKDHIAPQNTVTCPWDQCAQVLDAAQAPTHVMREHNPGSYVCLWQNCELSFPDHEQLDSHMKQAHARVDCHWAGCEVSKIGQNQLKSHVDMEHLFTNNLEDILVAPTQYEHQFQLPSYAENRPALHLSTQFATNSHSSPIQNGSKQFSHGSIVSPSLNALPSPMGSDQSALQIPIHPATPVFYKHSSLIGQVPEAHEVSVCMWITDLTTGKVCGMNFKDGIELQAHAEDVHVREYESRIQDPILCNWLRCRRVGKPLQSREKLRRHLYIHTGHWIAACSFCGKRFNNTPALENHERVHTGERPYACDECDQAFATDGALTIHKRHHTGAKPLICTVCEYACADSSNMAKHKKTHEPPEHPCPICNKKFSRSSTLERHMKVHDPTRPMKRKRPQTDYSTQLLLDTE